MLKKLKLTSLVVLALVASVGLAVVKPAPVSAGDLDWCTFHPDLYWGTSDRICTADLQIILNGVGLAEGYMDYAYLDPNGGFGPLTYNQVRAYQTAHHLGIDGRVGQQTWKSLCLRVVYLRNTGWLSDYYASAAWDAANRAACVKFSNNYRLFT